MFVQMATIKARRSLLWIVLLVAIAACQRNDQTAAATISASDSSTDISQDDERVTEQVMAVATETPSPTETPAPPEAVCEELSYDVDGNPLAVELCVPGGEVKDKLPAVLVLPGWQGLNYPEPPDDWDEQWEKQASLSEIADVIGWRLQEDLAQAGYIALAVNYVHFRNQSWNGARIFWNPAITTSVQVLREDPRVDPERIALVGYSFGANAAIHVMVEITDFKTAVWISGQFEPWMTEVTGPFPPMLLLHGEDDETVNPRNARFLHQKLEEIGADSTLDIVPNVGHLWIAEEARLGLDKVLAFLVEHL